MTELVPLVLSILLVGSSIGALLVRRLLWSLILMFYSSLLLGGILFWYGAVYAGLFHIITFAGAVSVMFMIILMLVGQGPPENDSGNRRAVVGAAIGILGFVPFAILIGGLASLSNSIQEISVVTSPVSDIGFLWNFWSWDLLFVLLPITAAVLVVVNLFSKEGEAE